MLTSGLLSCSFLFVYNCSALVEITEHQIKEKQLWIVISWKWRWILAKIKWAALYFRSGIVCEQKINERKTLSDEISVWISNVFQSSKESKTEKNNTRTHKTVVINVDRFNQQVQTELPIKAKLLGYIRIHTQINNNDWKQSNWIKCTTHCLHLCLSSSVSLFFPLSHTTAVT